MTPFEEFIKVNKLRKGDVAGYLGISASNISVYCKGGKIPDAQLQKILTNPEWDSTPLLDKQDNTDAISVLVSQVQLLAEQVSKQQEVCARYESMVKTMLSEYARLFSKNNPD